VQNVNLATAKVGRDGHLEVGDMSYGSLVVPTGVKFPETAATVVDQFVKVQGQVLRDSDPSAALSPETLKAKLEPAVKIDPESERIAVGRFIRDGRAIVVVVNVGEQPFDGTLSLAHSHGWIVLDPATGRVSTACIAENGDVALRLSAYETQLFFSAS
jgi:hypothetical protein